MNYTIDIDTGGSFTDGFITAGDRAEMVKVDTTPHDLTVCFLNCIEEGAKRLGLSSEELLSKTSTIRYSTTIGTNCLLQRNGPKLGLIVTDGYTESLFAAENNNTEADEVLLNIVPLSMRIAAKEEVDDSGRVIKEIDEEEVRQAVEYLLDSGARSMVISLRNSAFNSYNEKKAKATIDGEYPRHYLGSVPVLTTSAVTVHRDDNIRTNTAILNAYIHRDMVRYLYRADEALRRCGYRKPLLVTHSSGGVARVAKTTALNTYNSGPVAGLIGCTRMARELYGIENFVSLDVGGTSVDIGVGVGGKVAPDREPAVEGIRIGLPMVTLGTAAGGGGSIARVDFASKTVTVGPDSAGALPGPACYNLGGFEPAITDADLVLGFLDENYFLGGKKKIIKEKAVATIKDSIADNLDISVESAAWKIIQTSEEEVAKQIRENIEAKGLKPQELTLFAFGGGGGLRCCGYASRLGITKIVVFNYNAVASAFGASTMDILHTYEDSSRITLRTASGSFMAGEWKNFNQTIAELVDSAKRDMRGEGFAEDDLSFTLELGFSARGEFQWLELPLSQLQEEDEARKLAEAYASNANPDSLEIVIESITVKAQCIVPHYRLPLFQDKGTDAQKAEKGIREVYWGKGFINTKLYERDKLEFGNRIEGPAIIEAVDTTYVVPPDWTYTTDKYLNGILEVKRK